ncbi:MAG: SPOR domain-containing protein [Rhodocyclaceae bacterium]|nr:SPOR domain-containing protein [Rhodocyclaceae bacterium]
MADDDATLDAQTELKKRARRRLVGATALALLAVIVLPMVMDREPKPAPQDIQVRIPSQDAGTFTSRILPSKPAATPLPPVEPKGASGVMSEQRPDAATMPKPEGKAEPKASAKPEPKMPSPEAKPEPKPARPAAWPGGAPDASTAKPQPDLVKAESALSGSGEWVVQLGAYKEAGNVKLLIGKIREMKIPVYTEKLDTAGGTRTRVRAGPFPSRDAAEKVEARIRKIGVNGTVAPK